MFPRFIVLSFQMKSLLVIVFLLALEDAIEQSTHSLTLYSTIKKEKRKEKWRATSNQHVNQ